MQATIISLQPNITKQGNGGPYQVHLLKYQQDPSSGYPQKAPTERPVFAENRDIPDLAGKVLALQPGQHVELLFRPQARNPQFKELYDVIVMGSGPSYEQPGQNVQQQGNYQQAPMPQEQYQQQRPPQQTAPPAKPVYKGRDYVAEQKHKDEQQAITQISIQRQVCLKGALDIVLQLLQRDGYYAKKMKQELLIDEVVLFADSFEAYLLGLKKPFDPDQGLTEELPDTPYEDQP